MVGLLDGPGLHMLGHGLGQFIDNAFERQLRAFVTLVCGLLFILIEVIGSLLIGLGC